MAWFVNICEGRPFDVMVRAAEFALALTEPERDNVLFDKSDGYSPWRHLMSGPDQLALRELSMQHHAHRKTLEEVVQHVAKASSRGGELSASEMQSTQAQISSTQMQRLAMRTGHAVSVRPPPGCWLLMLSQADRVQPHQLAAYSRSMAFAPYIQCAPASWPVGVNKTVFARRKVAQHGPVLLIGHYDRTTNLQVLQDLLAAGAKHISLFDPYHLAGAYAGALPSHVSHFDACPPLDRARHAARCSCVVAAEAVYADNHFLWEAVALGLRPLGHLLPGAPQPNLPWTPNLLAQAWAAQQAHAEPQQVPEIVDWSDLVARLHGPDTAPAPRTPIMEVYLGAHRARVWHAMPPPDANATCPIILLSPASGVAPDVALHSSLKAYREVYIDLRENPELGIWLAEHGADWAVCRASEIEPLVANLRGRTEPVQLDVVHLDDTTERVQHVRAALTALHAGWERSAGQSRPPQILVHFNRKLDNAGASRRGIGVAVATETVVGGLELDAPGRYTLQWLGKHVPSSVRGRVYYYPFGERVGIEGDEADYAALPQLFAQDKIDLLCNVDPFLVGSTAARTAWARRAVPLVGMLHSIHTAGGSTEVLLQLLSGPSLPCDAILSPSRCGAVAYQGLLDAAADYLAPQLKEPPRFAGRLEVIPYGIDPAFYADLLPISCRAALSWPQDAPILLTMGRFARQEKADLLPLLLATQALLQRYPKLHLVLAGGKSPPPDENYAAVVRNLARDLGIGAHVRICEDVSTEDKFLMYGAADLVLAVSDSIQETYGVSILEAMAAGRPVVASGWNGYRELVRHGETGLLVPTYSVAPPRHSELVQRIAEGTAGYGHRDLHESVAVDPHALTAACQALLDSPAERHRMGEEARRVVAADYDQAKLARTLGDLLLQRVEEARHCPWPVPNARQPFADPVGQRFAHYPSGGTLDDSTVLIPGAWARVPVPSVSTVEAVRSQSLLQAVQVAPMRIADLVALMEAPGYDAAAVRLRIARCLKYGQLRRMDGGGGG